MKLKKNVIAFAMAVALGISTIAAPINVSAQVQYDPLLAGVNHGIYIDTLEVPQTTNGDITVNDNSKIINVKRNVTFKLNCSVDASWVVKANDDNNNSVRDGFVSIDPETGVVSITKEAEGGVYTVTATAQNVEKVDTATYKIDVDASSDAAKATDIQWDSEKMDCDQFSVSEDGKVLTIDGRVDKEAIAVKYSPSYVLDDERTFTNKNDKVYKLQKRQGNEGDEWVITTIDKSNSTSVGCTIGTGNAISNDGGLSIVVKRQDLKVSLECNELKTDTTYNLKMNQDVTYKIVSNDETTLPEARIQKGIVKWDVTQNEESVEADSDLYVKDENQYKKVDNEADATHRRYSVFGTDGKKNVKVAEFYISLNGQEMEVLTTTEDVDGVVVDAISLNGSYKNTIGTDDTLLAPISFRFHTSDVAKFSRATLDFGAVYEENVDFSVKKDVPLGTETVDVYYFEADGDNLNLAAATFADTLGVRTFQKSKENGFANGQTYSVSYELSNLPDSVFGSKKVAEKYNNNGLQANEINDDGTLANNAILTKQGTGYKVISVLCKKGNTEISKKKYVVRFVSSSNNIARLAVNKTQNQPYAEDETVHVRQGEAVTPYINVPNAKAITIFNPYLEYEVSDATVASVISDDNGNYKVNGLNSGKIVVTATGAVNKENKETFELYVNKDEYEGQFAISFKDAIASSKMDSAYAIDGKFESIPVNIVSLETNGGIPKLKWSLDCSEEVAVIDENTGVITTKKSSAGEKITVTAKSVSGTYEASEEFTIKEKSGTSILVLAEKVAVGATPVVTSTVDNAGSCSVGDSFQLYAKKFAPANATILSGTTTWKSLDETVATVSASGEVEAVGPGATKIVATYTYEGNAPVATEYSLSVAGVVNSVTDIQVAPTLPLNRIGATATIEATVVPAEATDKTLNYVSSDVKIATVSDTGVVTAVNVGECEITVSSKAVPSVSKKIKVTVGGEADKPITIEDVKAVAIKAINDTLGANPSATAKAIADKAIAEINAATTADAITAIQNKAVTDVTAQIAAEKAAADKAAADKAAADKAAADKAAAEKAAIEQEKAAFQKSTVKITSAKNSKSKSIVLKFKKVNGTGYQISYGTKSNFKGAKVKTTSKTSYTIKNLKKGKTYYVRVRAYKTIGGTKVYSKYSSKKKVVIKK